jgi:hypothetical protein
MTETYAQLHSGEVSLIKWEHQFCNALHPGPSKAVVTTITSKFTGFHQVLHALCRAGIPKILVEDLRNLSNNARTARRTTCHSHHSPANKLKVVRKKFSKKLPTVPLNGSWKWHSVVLLGSGVDLISISSGYENSA